MAGDGGIDHYDAERIAEDAAHRARYAAERHADERINVLERELGQRIAELELEVRDLAGKLRELREETAAALAEGGTLG